MMFLLLCPSSYSIINGCEVYTQNNGESICSKCQDNYYLTPDQLNCNLCVDGCAKCDSDGMCLQCGPNTYSNNGACPNCFSGCTHCNSTTCTQCASGLTLTSSGNSCIVCGVYCLICSTSGNCDRCIPGYVFQFSEIGVKSCRAARPNYTAGAAIIFIIALGVFILLSC